MPRRARPPSLNFDAAPIPPSLLASPFLSSPAFTRPLPIPAPRPPTEQDELWLQDTVPLPVSPSSSESSGSLRDLQPQKPRPQFYPRPVPQSPPIVINRPRHTHVRGHTCPEGGHLANFSNDRNSYSHSGSSSEPQTPLSTSSSSGRSPPPYRSPDAVDTRPPRRLEFSHVRIHSEPTFSTHTDSFRLINLRTPEESRPSGMCPHKEFGCGPAASD